MPPDKLILPHFTIKQLYGNNVIKINQTIPNSTDESTKIKYLGGNQQRIIILVNNETHPFLDNDQLSFLIKVIGACKLTLADIALINLQKAEKEVLLIQTKKELKPKKVILFGVPLSTFALPFQLPEFQIQLYDEVEYVTAPPLFTIEGDQQLKKKLWGCFQKMFL